MDWTSLTAFRTVADERSFTRAAAKLHVTQPSLSRRIAKLERSLGVQLLDRSNHGVELTDAGRLLRTRLEDITTIWHDTGRDLRAMVTATPVTPLRIAFSSGKASALLRLLSASLPAVAWETKRVLPDPALAALAAGTVDFAYTYRLSSHPPRPIDGVRTVTIAHQPVWLVVARNHPLARYKQVALADLAEETWVTNTPSHPLRESDAAVFRAAGFEPKIAHVVDINTDTLDLIATGRYLSLGIPLTDLDDRVVTIPLSDESRRHVFLAWRPTRVSEDTARRVEVMRDYYRGQAKRFPHYWSWILDHPEDFPGLVEQASD
ncbi:MAG: LysR family transcriptional regulator [Kutzneria sp.]|nr:LysR family transcriptional regulator [Kutzneria sp.]MBV9846738.1 LysR family transcriptional regulator [Kutzneria sp.]